MPSVPDLYLFSELEPPERRGGCGDPVPGSRGGGLGRSKGYREKNISRPD